MTYAEDPEKLEYSKIKAFLKTLRNFQYYRRSRPMNNIKVAQIAQEVPNFKYLVVGEYGGKYGRPHYHMIIFNYLPKEFGGTYITRSRIYKELFDTWGSGIVHLGNVTQASINYTCKYIFKSGEENKPFRILSNGLGSTYIEKMAEWHRENPTERQKGIIYSKEFHLPQYVKRKIFSEKMRDFIAISNEEKNDILRAEQYKDAETSIMTITNYWELDKQKQSIFNTKKNEKQTL